MGRDRSIVEFGNTSDVCSLIESASSPRPRWVACTLAYHPITERIGEEHAVPATSRWSLRLSRLEPGFARDEGEEPMPLGIQTLSRDPLELRARGDLIDITTSGRASIRVDGETLAAHMELPASRLEAGLVIELGTSVVLFVHLRQRARAPFVDELGLLGRSDGIAHVRAELERVADLSVPVLVRGETGTGKELAARALHRLSGRRGAFVAVNMGAVSETTAAAELFGHVRGAFTDAKADGKGYFQSADGGTLFLDEIGEAPSELQVKLLRVLETGEVLRVGSAQPLPLDVRVVAATDADLEGSIRARRFKAPLFHRLAQYLVELPPLRERKCDVAELFLRFVREGLEKTRQTERLNAAAPYFPASLMARVVMNDWPGNVRQLRSAAHALAISHRGRTEFELTPEVEQHFTGTEPAAVPVSERKRSARTAPTLQLPAVRPSAGGGGGAVSDAAALEALRDNDWEVRPAARQLGIAPNTLYQIIARSPELRRASDLSRATIEDALAQAHDDQAVAARALRLSLRALRQRMRELGLL